MTVGDRIAIIGNAGGGKSTLARRLGEILGLPVFHVDSIQYRSGWQRTPADECDRLLEGIAQGPRWIIDGFGGDRVISNRVERADTLVHVDFPLWRHYWWAMKRQLASRHGQREELPQNCPEFSLGHTVALMKVMWRVHTDYTPGFRAMLEARNGTGSGVVLRSPRDLAAFLRDVEREHASHAGAGRPAGNH